jgi:LPS export ABC transporter protein LptC
VRLAITIIFLFYSLAAFSNEHMSNISFTQFNTNGEIESSMHAQYIDYHDHIIIINKPHIFQDHWEITSNMATTSPKFELVSFSEQVTILDKNDPTFSIKTQKLDYLIAQKVFTSSEYVVFNKQHIKTTGIGLQANLQSNKIKILNDVHTIVEMH